MTRFWRGLPWFSGAVAILALVMAAASALYGVADIGLSLGAHLLFLAILPWAAVPWKDRRRPRGIVLPP